MRKFTIPNLKTEIGMGHSSECVAFPPLIFVGILAFVAF